MASRWTAAETWAAYMQDPSPAWLADRLLKPASQHRFLARRQLPAAASSGWPPRPMLLHCLLGHMYTRTWAICRRPLVGRGQFILVAGEMKPSEGTRSTAIHTSIHVYIHTCSLDYAMYILAVPIYIHIYAHGCMFPAGCVHAYTHTYILGASRYISNTYIRTEPAAVDDPRRRPCMAVVPSGRPKGDLSRPCCRSHPHITAHRGRQETAGGCTSGRRRHSGPGPCGRNAVCWGIHCICTVLYVRRSPDACRARPTTSWLCWPVAEHAARLACARRILCASAYHGLLYYNAACLVAAAAHSFQPSQVTLHGLLSLLAPRLRFSLVHNPCTPPSHERWPVLNSPDSAPLPVTRARPIAPSSPNCSRRVPSLCLRCNLASWALPAQTRLRALQPSVLCESAHSLTHPYINAGPSCAACYHSPTVPCQRRPPPHRPQLTPPRPAALFLYSRPMYGPAKLQPTHRLLASSFRPT